MEETVIGIIYQILLKIALKTMEKIDTGLNCQI